VGDAPFSLRALESCFRGAVPATIATCSPEGIPNITYLSIVHCVDDTHLALSFQFFNKTHENIAANPKAQILVPDPTNLEQYRMDVRYERTEHEGPVFERMRANLDAVATMTGMSSVFSLRGADIYRVVRIEKLAHDLDLSETAIAPDHVAALEVLSERLAACEELDALLDTTLAGLAELLDHPHSMILFADEHGTRLYTVASHGFERSGVGAEVPFGVGPIGTAAQERRVILLANLRMELMMADAVRAISIEQGETLEAREIPLPGLSQALSQLAVPILARDRTLGVLCVQSARPGRITLADEQVLTTLCRYLATSIQLLGQIGSGDAPSGRSYTRAPAGGDAMRIRFHGSDDSVFVDGEYLVKGLPGRILFKLLGLHERDGRVDFTNRELRLDESLQLGGFRDNLEARLILLRRRLEERCPALRLAKTGRGRFRLELGRAFVLERAS
jgi:adenylate cyclase